MINLLVAVHLRETLPTKFFTFSAVSISVSTISALSSIFGPPPSGGRDPMKLPLSVCQLVSMLVDQYVSKSGKSFSQKRLIGFF